MQYEFTPGADRALAAADKWNCHSNCDELVAPALLLGLLAESECRAALKLAAHGITSEVVQQHWPELALSARPERGVTAQPRRFSTEVQSSLETACELLADSPRPLVLATEHLLLGLVGAQHDVAVWLTDRGLDPQQLKAEIQRFYGFTAEPLPLQDETSQGEEPLVISLWQNRQAQTAGMPPVVAPPETPPVITDRSASVHGDGDSPGQHSTAAIHQSPAPGPAEAPSIRVLRVIDAAANRAAEGLRAVEDFVRFILDDLHLTTLCKHLRHDLATSLEDIPTLQRLVARETTADVGTALSTPGEQHRKDFSAILNANFARVQEGLRSLEEFGKLLDPALGQRMKQLRYRTYTLQRAVEITRTSLDRLNAARLYVLIDGRPSAEQFLHLARSLIEAGVHIIQLRDKQLDDRRLLERARQLRDLTHGSSTLFIVNDRPDLALLAQADGVHIGQEELSVKDARTLLGPTSLIGVSTHSPQQARQAVLDGANYLGLGPVFPSTTKQFSQFPGLELLRVVSAEIRLPTFAIGGITRANLPQVLGAGATRVAASGAVLTAKDPLSEARQWLAMLEKSRGSHQEPR